MTIAAESICALIFPLFWRHVYIPLMPAALTDFVCAPMPYIVGVLSSYMPDELMLDQVVVVHLDRNHLDMINTTLPPLPDARASSLLRGLKKAVPSADPAQPLHNPTAAVDDFNVEVCFLKLFVKLLGTYRNYLEAPAEYVLDKIDRERLMAEHPESGPFLTEFLDTQMFQCFVDDRYEASAQAWATAAVAAHGHPGHHLQQQQQHLDILFFDEMVDKSNGKPTPFLTDTSQDHARLPVVAVKANSTALPSNWQELTGASLAHTGLLSISHDSGDAAAVLGAGGSANPYELGWPLLAHADWFTQGVRPVTPLVPLTNAAGSNAAGALASGSAGAGGAAGGLASSSSSSSAGSNATATTSTGGGSGDLGRLNLKFFADKRLYTQHFHALRLKSSKQDSLFKDVVRYLTNQQACDEDIAAGVDKLCAATVNATPLVTATSIDKPWQTILTSLEAHAHRDAVLLQQSRQDVFVPLATAVVEAEQRLRILFSEAARLENQVCQSCIFYLIRIIIHANQFLISCGVISMVHYSPNVSHPSLCHLDLLYLFLVQAGQAKAVSEKAKKKAEFTKQRYAALVNKRAVSSSSESMFNSFSSVDLHKVLDAHSAMEDAGLALDQVRVPHKTTISR